MDSSGDKKVQSSMLNESGESGPRGLQLFRFGPQADSQNTVLIVPNGYGVLRYAHELGGRLGKAEHCTVTVNLRGQGGVAGEVGIRSAAEDLASLISWAAKGRSESVSIVAHCSAMLPLLTLQQDAGLWEQVNGVVQYCYLAQPREHEQRFRRRARGYGVRLSEQIGDLGEFNPEAYSAFPVPLMVVHPQTNRNRRRATTQDLEKLEEIIGRKALLTPPTGYDITNRSQARLVAATVEQCLNPILRTFQTDR